MISKSNIVISLLLFSIIFIAVSIYWPGLNGPFLLDDVQNVVSTYLSEFNLSEVIYASTHNVSGDLGRPVSALSFTLSGLMHGPDSWGYKYHNLLIHLINSLLILWLLIKVIPYLDPRLNEKRSLLIAGVVSSCWLLHPLMVSTVLYVVQRMAELSALFTLLSLLAYVIGRENIDKNRYLFYLSFYGLFPVFLILAMLAKENGALIPFYVIAIEIFVFKFEFQDRAAKKQILFFLTLFSVAPIVLGSLYVAINFDDYTSYASRNFNMYERLLTESHVIFFYIKLILLPAISDMSLFHDDFTVVRKIDLVTSIFILLILCLISLIFLLRKKAPVIAFGLAWFFISHLMESTFIDLELVFEHRNYLAMLGLIFPVLYYLLRAQKYPWMQYVAYLIVALMASLTAFRVQEWKSDELIYLVAVTEHPGSPRANTEYANISYSRGEYDRAIEHLNIVQELKPYDAGAVIHKIVFLCVGGKSVDEELIDAKRLLAESPATPYILNAIDNLITKRDVNSCSGVALADILELVQIASSQKDTLQKKTFLGFLQRLEGKIYFISGNYPQGVELFLRSYATNSWVGTLFDLAEVQLLYGQLDDVRGTIAKIESINSSSYGIEDSKLELLKTRLEEKAVEVKPEG